MQARRRLIGAVCGLLVSAVAVVFGQTVTHQFVNYDDPEYVYENAHVRHGISIEAVLWALTDRYAGNWHPLTWMSHMLDCQIYGLWAGGHHLTNVLIHAATAVGLFLVLLRMTGRLWPSALAAAVFAIHPLRVESVAWVAERKDLLAGLFFVLTVWAYLAYAGRPFSAWRYLLVVACFVLGLMAKPMLVTLPAVLLLLDYWPLGRLGTCNVYVAGTRRVRSAPARPENKSPGCLEGTAPMEARSASEARRAGAPRLRFGLPFRRGELGSYFPVCTTAHGVRLLPFLQRVLEKLPLLAIAGMSCAVTLWAQQSALIAMERLPLSVRLANAATACTNYLGSFFWPVRLAAFYPMPAEGLPIWGAVTAAAILAGISAAVVAMRRSRPYLLVGWLWYLGMLVPVIGIVQVGEQARADRYTYLPQIGLAIALAWSTAALFRRFPARRRLGVCVVGLTLACLLGDAWRQTGFWADSETLWTRTLAVSSRNALAHANFGGYLLNLGRLPQAIEHFQQALQVDPDYAEAHYNFGLALFRSGRTAEAIEQYRQAIRVKPDYAKAYNNLGDALQKRGDVSAALALYRKALQIQPTYKLARYNLGSALAACGEIDAALAEYERALENDSANAVAFNYVGLFLAGQHRVDEAMAHYRTALQLQPDFAEAHYNLGNALLKSGRIAEAVEHLRCVVRLADAAGQQAMVESAVAQLQQLGERGP
jgi:tetratricopeptide (TPR) repeat protein